MEVIMSIYVRIFTLCMLSLEALGHPLCAAPTLPYCAPSTSASAQLVTPSAYSSYAKEPARIHGPAYWQGLAVTPASLKKEPSTSNRLHREKMYIDTAHDLYQKLTRNEIPLTDNILAQNTLAQLETLNDKELTTDELFWYSLVAEKIADRLKDEQEHTLTSTQINHAYYAAPYRSWKWRGGFIGGIASFFTSLLFTEEPQNSFLCTALGAGLGTLIGNYYAHKKVAQISPRPHIPRQTPVGKSTLAILAHDCYAAIQERYTKEISSPAHDHDAAQSLKKINDSLQRLRTMMPQESSTRTAFSGSLKNDIMGNI